MPSNAPEHLERSNIYYTTKRSGETDRTTQQHANKNRRTRTSSTEGDKETPKTSTNLDPTFSNYEPSPAEIHAKLETSETNRQQPLERGMRQHTTRARKAATRHATTQPTTRHELPATRDPTSMHKNITTGKLTGPPHSPARVPC